MGLINNANSTRIGYNTWNTREIGEDAGKADKRLDTLYGTDRPKCRICAGRLDRSLLFRRCPWCGTPEALEVGR